MTRKEQNKILDAKIESNVNQYKVDRLNAEISAFSSGDLNKYEFLKRIDLNYKPNALDKARFEFSPLGKTFNAGLDKTAQGYQEEGVMKLLKDVRDSLRGSARPTRPDNNDNNDNNNNDDDDNDKEFVSPLLEEINNKKYTNDDDDDDDDDDKEFVSPLLEEVNNKKYTNYDDDDDDDDDDDNRTDYNNMPDLETEEEALERISTNKLDKFKNNIEIEMNNLDKIVKNEKNQFSTN